METTNNETGACILFLDFPTGNEIGIDFKSWKVGHRFKGLKGIPPGLHLIYSSAVDKCGQVGFRTGFFANLETDSIVVKKWDANNEWFIDGPSSEEDMQRFRDNLPEISTHLGPYPNEIYSKWIAHSCHISAPILTRVIPHNRIDCVPNYVSPSSNTEQRREQARLKAEVTRPDAEDGVSSPGHPIAKTMQSEVPTSSCSQSPPSSQTNPETNMKFSPIEMRSFPPGCEPSEISRHMMDKSYALGELFASYATDGESSTPASLLLGEFQLAFLAFLLCSDFEGFEQWKRMCALLCRCESALPEHSSMFEALVAALYHQLNEIPHDFFTDIVSRENFLVDSLHHFFAGVDANEDCPASLRRKVEGFRQHLLQRFDWDFAEDCEEDLPVVVDHQH